MKGYEATPTRQLTYQRGWAIVIALVFVLAAGSAVQAQTVPVADAAAPASEMQVFRHPSGVEIHVLQLRPGIGDDEMIEALESAARLLRGSHNVAPVAHQELAPEPAPEIVPAAALEPSAPTATAQVPILPPPAPLNPPPPPEATTNCQHAGPPTVGSLAGVTSTTVSSTDWIGEWCEYHHLQGLPSTLLWKPPMANALQPRMTLDLTSLNNDTTKQTADTAIGGEIALFRFTPLVGSGLVIEPDAFAVVLSRFADYRTFTDADFRFGAPVTFAYDNWHAKIGYEHTSSHIGDDYSQATGVFKQADIHNELVVGLDYVFADQLRLYGVAAYAFDMKTQTPSSRGRFDWGVEWSENKTTDWKGQPFAAFDMELRGDQDFVADMTLQFGWQWKEIDTGHSFRTGVEVYDGRSPYGQFYLNHEEYVGFGVWVDF